MRVAPEPDPSVATTPARERFRPSGVTWMVAGAFGFSVMSLFVKLAGERLPTMQIVWARAIVTLALSLAIVARARVSPLGSDRGGLLLRGLLGFGALSAFYWSVVHLPLAEATVLQYTNPFFAALLAFVVLRERMARADVAALAVGFVGVVLVARPSAGALGVPPQALAVSLVAAALSGAAYVMVRRLRKSEHPDVIVLSFAAVSAVGAAPFALAGWVWPTAAEWLVLLGVGIATQVGQFCLTRGLHLETAGRATTVGYTQVVFATLWGALFLRELPTPLVLAGAGLVLLGSVLLAVRTR